MKGILLYVVIDNTSPEWGESACTMKSALKRLADSLNKQPKIGGARVYPAIHFPHEQGQRYFGYNAGKVFSVPEFPGTGLADWDLFWRDLFKHLDENKDQDDDPFDRSRPVILFFSIDGDGWFKLNRILKKRENKAHSGKQVDLRLVAVSVDGNQMICGHNVRIGTNAELSGGIEIGPDNCAETIREEIETLFNMTEERLRRICDADADEWNDIQELLAETDREAENEPEPDAGRGEPIAQNRPPIHPAPAGETRAAANCWENSPAKRKKVRLNPAEEPVPAASRERPSAEKTVPAAIGDPFDPAPPTAPAAPHVAPGGTAVGGLSPETGSEGGERGVRRVCPFCCTEQTLRRGTPCPNGECYSNRRGIPMPSEVFTHELFPIAIVGASSSGKSHFLATLKHRLVNEGFWGAGKSDGYWKWAFVEYFNPLNADDASVDNPYIVYETNLYQRHQTLDSTRRDDEHPPLLLSVDYLHPVRRLFDEPRFFKKGLLVAVTDTAGEHAQSGSIGSFEKNYPALRKLAKGIVVMLDPKEVDGSANESANGILSSFKRGRRKAKIPVALCLSKTDELANSGEPVPGEWLDERFDTDLTHPGRLVLPDIENNSRDILKWMRGTKLRATADDLENSFRYHACFATSALGINPFVDDAGGKHVLASASGALSLKPGFPCPLRVLDPLLWILWQHGKLGGSAVTTVSRRK